MRFGKRLAEISDGGRAREPYVSYKELKHIISRVALLLSGGGRERDSSGDEFSATGDEDFGDFSSLPAGRPGQSSSSSALPSSLKAKRVQALQEEFFWKINADLAQARVYVQSIVSDLEAAMGEWQAAAVLSGLLFTPDQLREVASEMPFKVKSDEVLVEWLMSMRKPTCSPDKTKKLLSKYNLLTGGINSLLQYVEINLTAVRKIFKKFDKKIPGDHRAQSTRDFLGHKQLVVPEMQDLLITARQVQQLIMSLHTEVPPIGLSQVGPETALLFPRGCRGALRDIAIGYSTPAARIDVYAKPTAELPPGTISASSTAVAARTSSERGMATLQQDILNLGSTTTTVAGVVESHGCIDFFAKPVLEPVVGPVCSSSCRGHGGAGAKDLVPTLVAGENPPAVRRTASGKGVGDVEARGSGRGRRRGGRGNRGGVDARRGSRVVGQEDSEAQWQRLGDKGAGGASAASGAPAGQPLSHGSCWPTAPGSGAAAAADSRAPGALLGCGMSMQGLPAGMVGMPLSLGNASGVPFNVFAAQGVMPMIWWANTNGGYIPAEGVLQAVPQHGGVVI